MEPVRQALPESNYIRTYWQGDKLVLILRRQIDQLQSIRRTEHLLSAVARTTLPKGRLELDTSRGHEILPACLVPPNLNKQIAPPGGGPDERLERNSPSWEPVGSGRGPGGANRTKFPAH
ncbi:MAG: hypothetical protein MUC92_02110 [Fimbriimonadaceae bacterium]|nr:hypothetical protein [Fimbriimonadaceae bacterium]